MSTATLPSRRHPAQQRSTSTLSQRSGSSATPLPLRSTSREASPAPSALAQIPSAETVFNSAPRNSSSFTPSRFSTGPIVTDAWMKPFQDVCAIEITPRRTVTSPHLIVTSHQLSMSAHRSHNTPISAPSSAHVGGSSPAPSLYRDPTRRTPRQETVMFGVDFEDAARKRQAVYLAEEGNTMKRAAEANAMKSYIVAPLARTQGCSSTAPSSITGSGSVCASSVTFLDILKQKKDKERRTTTTGSAATTATATTTTLQNSNTTTTPMFIDSQSHRAALEESVATPKTGAVKASSLLSQYLSVANSVGGSTAKAVASTSPALEEPQAISSSSSDGSDKSKESSLVDKINTSEESPTNNAYDETQKGAHADPSQIELQREDERLPEALLEEELDVPTSWGTPPPPPPLVSNPRAALSHVDHGADLNAELLQFTHSRLGLTTATGTSRGASLQSSNTLQAQILQSFGTFLSANWANATANQLDPKTHALLPMFIGSSDDTTTELKHLESDVRDAVIDAAIEYYVLETITDVLNNNAVSEEFEEGE